MLIDVLYITASPVDKRSGGSRGVKLARGSRLAAYKVWPFSPSGIARHSWSAQSNLLLAVPTKLARQSSRPHQICEAQAQ